MMLEAAEEYAQLGYKVFPLAPGLKRPHGGLVPHGVSEASDDVEKVRRWFTREPSANLGLACDGLIVIDCDLGNTWPGLERLKSEGHAVVQNTPSGGMHFLFRRPPGKAWNNSTSRLAHNIDTRTAGGYIVISPSSTIECPEEKTVAGDYFFEKSLPAFAKLSFPPQWLVDELDKCFEPKPVALPQVSPLPETASTDVTERAKLYLDACPEAISGQGGHNQTFKAAQALVNGFCLEPEVALRLLLEYYNPRCEPPWSEPELRHKVDSAMNNPSEKARGWLRDSELVIQENSAGVDIDGIVNASEEEAICEEENAKPEIIDPGPVPDSLLAMPGFVGEVIDFCMTYAPYPSLGMAFCGAVAMQSHLCGRKVREEGDLRTNLYLLALASSSVGKNYPREINTHLSIAAGVAETIGTKFSSGEAIEDKLEAHPCMLFQTDEIDGILQSVGKARDARHESTISTLLTMFSSANMMYPKRAKAGNQGGSIIHQPHLSVFGTATPAHFYEALTERMLTNGLFARMTTIDTGKRAPGQDSRPSDTLPERLIEAAKWWGNFQPGEHRGNLIGFFPKPIIVPYTEDGRNSARDFRSFADSEYSKAEDRNDEVAMTVWGRANENARKLALIYACSENHKDPQITLSAMHWAEAFVEHQVRRMLYMASQYVCRDDFDGHCKLAIRILRDWHAKKGANVVLPPWKFRRMLNLHPTAFKDVTFELIERRQIKLDVQPGKTKPKQGFRLL